MNSDPLTHSPSSGKIPEQDPVSAFRLQIKHLKHKDIGGWELTRKLVETSSLSRTLQQLRKQVQQSACPPFVKEKLLVALTSSSNTALSSKGNTEQLKELTGLAPTKAIRALCLYFGLGDEENQEHFTVDPGEIEDFIRNCLNPYEWLLNASYPSLLDLGAGDLSFEEEFVKQYLAHLKKANKSLTLHALDRLKPGSQFGGAYHVNQERLAHLSQYPSEELAFRFWGAKDMFDPTAPRELLKTYSIVTCHAPATPTFAYEPRRLSERIIQEHLKQTKGNFKTVRIHGEEALEVHHGNRILTFPSWKFAIRGPLALLDLIAQRGQVCILSSIDAEVFWEILAQLVENDTMRPSNTVFTRENIQEIFEEVFEPLSSLQEGDRCCLSNLTPLRTQLPHVLTSKPRGSQGFRFRYVELRRGAVFTDMPTGFTSRQFSKMTEEESPWCLILIPEQLNA